MVSLDDSRATRFLFLICVFLTSQVSSQDTLRQGDRLNSTARLVSAGRIFALGFYTPSGTNNSYLAIQYANESLYSPPWIGNRDKPFSRNSNPVLTIDSSTGKLVITTTGGGESVEIYSGGSNKNVTATLLDTGNFVVKDMSLNGEVLWQSFDHPTDTLLPGMKLGVNHRTGRNWTLTSWFGQSDPAPGAFTMEWDPSSGMLLVKWRGMIRWTSGKMKDYYMEPGNLQVKEFEKFFTPDPDNYNYNFTNVASKDEEYFIYSLINVPDRTMEGRTMISGWRLNSDGDIHDTDRGTIANPSLCYGYNNEDYGVRGCELWEQPECRNTRETFDWRSGDFRPDKGQGLRVIDDGNSSLTSSDCRDFCWRDCECAAYTTGNTGCVYWKGKNLEFVQSVDGSSVKKYFLVSAPSSKGMKSHVKIILAVVGAAVLLLFGIGLFIVRKIKQGKRKEELQELLTLEGYTENDELENGVAKTHDLRLFTYASIQSATRNFSLKHKLGQGGFGPVYKGKTVEGQHIAVKLLSQQSGQGLLEFKTELVLISKLQHVNLVKLLGFCIHGNDKMIIYEYMPNKSLDFYLFSSSEREKLDWPCRFNIIEGIAQGLLYLHRYSRLKIIHRDLKPSNILLDENLNPKISDFGLARIFTKNIDEANTNRRVGTYGYMAPEYAMQGIFSVKSDVYSFGVLVLEIVSGLKNSSFHEIEGPLNLVEHAWELWKTNSAIELMDQSLKATCRTDQVQRCIHVGLLCIENHAANRPTIEDVISMLKNDIADLPMPQNPAFVTRKRSMIEEVEMTPPDKLLSSANELTISEMGGR